MVRTLPFHGNNTGSNPVRDINIKRAFMKKYNLQTLALFVVTVSPLFARNCKYYDGRYVVERKSTSLVF